MKRIILSAAIAAAIAATGMAQDKPANPANPQDRPSATSQDKSQDKSMSGKSMRGTVSSVDQSLKSFVIKDESGKEVTVYWDSATKVTGDLKAGSMVSFQASESSGRWTASSIEVSGAKKPY